MCGKSFKKVDYLDCKIIAIELKKRVFVSHPTKQVQQTFKLGLKQHFAIHKVEAFDIILEN
jgi:hypothetical protein